MSRLEEPYTNAYDIYRYNSMVFANTPRFTVRGKALVTDSADCEEYKVKLTDPETGEEFYTTQANPDGSYELIVPAGTYAVVVEDCEGNKDESVVTVEDSEEMPVILLAGIDDSEEDTTTPVPVPVDITVDTFLLKHILFGFDSYKVQSGYSEFLNELSILLNNNPSLVIQIAGYTDAIGNASYNLILSKRRAQSVADYLATNDVAKDQMKVVSYGEDKPVARNNNSDGSDNPKGRKFNRRVEIIPLSEITNLFIINKLDVPENLLY
jgi:outer membrane protein OmpA-like peptidoglycan-associated protein